MRQRCEYCGNWIDDTDETCPHCGAPNEHMMASAEGVPKTIEELKAFCEAHHLPLEDMRFFVGEDFKEPRAFGIYQDGEDFVVYKNKANGERAVRYRGHDEAYAVNELYQKMKSEIANQRLHQANKGAGRRREMRAKAREAHARGAKGRGAKGGRWARIRSNLDVIIVLAVLVASVGALIYMMVDGPYAGYYDYEDTTYYHNGSGWYYFDATASDWTRDDDPPATLLENSQDYYTTYEWDDSLGATDFTESPYYVPPSSSDEGDDDGWYDWDSDWDDDDWDWDSSDTWDSGYTDWDSDW